MASKWDGPTKDAMKILGDQGKVPKWPSSIVKAEAEDDKSYVAYQKTRDELKVKLLATQNTRQALKDAISQLQDEVDESDLGLDPKNKDDAKKIKDAQKVLSGWLDTQIATFERDYKNLKELDKHLMSLMNYKQGS
jgi:hypothetical protein